MPDLPRVALILLRAEWFEGVVALPELPEAVEADAKVIHEQLGSIVQVVGSWVVNSPESLLACLQALPRAQVDLFLLAFQVWAEDWTLQPLAEVIGARPLAVWCYLPWRIPPRPLSFTGVLRGSGPVGTFEGLGTLRNLGVNYVFLHGAPDDPRFYRQLVVIARAARVRVALRSARIGLLPGRNPQMQSTYVDEFRLRATIGPQVRLLSVGDLRRMVDSLDESEVQDYVAHLEENYLIQGVEAETLAHAARASLGLARLAVHRQLDVLSVDDINPELHEVMGLRPCLVPPLLEQHSAALALEGDLGAATALYILRWLAGGALLFVEFWYWDESENLAVGGHAGVQDPRVAAPGSAWISHDYEFARSDPSPGAQLQFVAKPGRITLLQLRAAPEGWQAITATGEAVETEPWLEGYPHAVIRLDAPIDRWIRRVAAVGSTQHWIMGYGDHLPELRALFDLLGVPLEVISG